ncbi:unnamed protein product [Gongylonema pulchrum]|uniref:Dymeclin n=1 Tax=Gongylonema pulchrum TaxID=637853 RepID=A0A183D921_9BILA|nr:unnamed protein product [Gongylonema pulchrum]
MPQYMYSVVFIIVISDGSDVEAEYDNLYENKAEEFLDVLVDILIDLPVNDSTEAIHIEALKCIIALLSSQLYYDSVLKSNIFYGYLMQGRRYAHINVFEYE